MTKTTLLFVLGLTICLIVTLEAYQQQEEEDSNDLFKQKLRSLLLEARKREFLYETVKEDIERRLMEQLDQRRNYNIRYEDKNTRDKIYDIDSMPI